MAKNQVVVVVALPSGVCSLGEGAVTLHFPTGIPSSLSFQDTVEAKRAYGILQRWLLDHLEVAVRRTVEQLTEETDG